MIWNSTVQHNIAQHTAHHSIALLTVCTLVCVEQKVLYEQYTMLVSYSIYVGPDAMLHDVTYARADATTDA